MTQSRSGGLILSSRNRKAILFIRPFSHPLSGPRRLGRRSADPLFKGESKVVERNLPNPFKNSANLIYVRRYSRFFNETWKKLVLQEIYFNRFDFDFVMERTTKENNRRRLGRKFNKDRFNDPGFEMRRNKMRKL